MPGNGDESTAVAALSAVTTLDIGLAPSVAMGMTYMATAHSLGLAMANATASQQRGQTVADAALGQVLALIISAPARTTGRTK
jgi:hypothetical protein